jgi:hypothetical protein
MFYTQRLAPGAQFRLSALARFFPKNIALTLDLRGLQRSDTGQYTPYTGWYCECAGPPSKLACLTTIAILALEPNGIPMQLKISSFYQ